MIVTASTPGGLMNACIEAVQRYEPPGTSPATVVTPAAVAPPGQGTALPEVTDGATAQPTAVVSPLSGTLARQAYQAQASAVRQAQMVG